LESFGCPKGRGIQVVFIPVLQAIDVKCPADALLIQQVYKVGPLDCPNCGAAMRIIALIDATDVIERILPYLAVWDPRPASAHSAGSDAEQQPDSVQ